MWSHKTRPFKNDIVLRLGGWKRQEGFHLKNESFFLALWPNWIPSTCPIQDPLPGFTISRWELARFHSLKPRLPLAGTSSHLLPHLCSISSAFWHQFMGSCRTRGRCMTGVLCLEWKTYPRQACHSTSIFCRHFNTKMIEVGGGSMGEDCWVMQGSCGCQNPKRTSLLLINSSRRSQPPLSELLSAS